MKYQLSKTRIEMEKAYLEICKRRQYVGARRSDILDWLAEYADKRDADLKAKYQKAVEALKFECGNRCAEQNPCNAKETLAELGEKE